MNSTFSFQWKEEEQKSHSCPIRTHHLTLPRRTNTANCELL